MEWEKFNGPPKKFTVEDLKKAIEVLNKMRRPTKEETHWFGCNDRQREIFLSAGYRPENIHPPILMIC